MRGYTNNTDLMVNHMARYIGRHEVYIAEIKTLKVRMPAFDGRAMTVVSIDETPHYQYALGNTQPYQDWLIKRKYSLRMDALASFEHLMNNDLDYLDGEYTQDFIFHDHELVIIDGVHRATRLFQLGVLMAPVLRPI